MGQQAFLSSHEFYSRNVSCSIVTPYCKILSIASTNSVCLPAFRSSFSFFRYCSGRFRPFCGTVPQSALPYAWVQAVETPFAGFQTYKTAQINIRPESNLHSFPCRSSQFFKKFFLPRAQKAAVINNKFFRLFSASKYSS